MPETRFGSGSGGPCGRDVCCIETDRIYDSCRDRDCFENVYVSLTDFGNDTISRTSNIRAKDAYIAWTYIGIDPVRFNRGFYTVNIRYFIKIHFEACIGSNKPVEFEGVAALDKKVVLFGGEKNVNVFRSDPDAYGLCARPEAVDCSMRAPTAVVEVTDPIVLDAKVYEKMSAPSCSCVCHCSDLPDIVLSQLEAPISGDDCDPGRFIAVSLGIFSVIRIVRPTQLLVNATEYCVPDKECIVPHEESPCAIFNNMAFPIGEFSPPIPPQIGPCGGKCT